MYTSKLFESYNQQLNEKINKDNIEINRAIANPNAGKNADKLKAAGYELSTNNDKITHIKNPKTGKWINPTLYTRDEKQKVDFKGKLDSTRKNIETTAYVDNKTPKLAKISDGRYNADETKYYSNTNYSWEEPSYKSISKNIRDYKDAVKTRDDSTKSAETSKDHLNYYIDKVKQAQDDLDRRNKHIKRKEKEASDAEARRKAIIDNIRKRKTESEHLNESVDFEDMLKELYNSYKQDGMEDNFWSDLMNCIDNLEYLNQWYSSLNESAKTKLEEAYSERYGGDPKDFIEDVISIKAKLEELNLDGFGSHLAQQMVEEFIETCDSQISMVKGKIEAGDFKESEDLDEGIISDLKQKHLADKIGKTHAKMMSNENPSKINKKQYDKNWKKIHSLGKKERDKELSKAKKNNEKSYELSKKADEHIKKANLASTKVDNLIKQATDKYLDKTNKSEK